MEHSKNLLAELLKNVDFGSSIAENDTLLETARVETSVFNELLNDKVDLIPGTKGSGKSALYRIFVDFLPGYLLDLRKVVVAHGVQQHGNEVFDTYRSYFKKMNEQEFVDFWCIYLVSLANEQFIKGARYKGHLKKCSQEIDSFHRACRKAMPNNSLRLCGAVANKKIVVGNAASQSQQHATRSWALTQIRAFFLLFLLFVTPIKPPG